MAFPLAAVLVAAAASRPVQPIGSAGDGWQPVGPPVAITSIAVDPNDASAVYATYLDPFLRESGAMRSADFGESWAVLAESLPGDTAVSIAVDPLEGLHLFAAASRGVPNAGASRVYDSIDGGLTWAFRADLPETVCRGFQFDRAHAAVYLLGCGGTLFGSLDGGLSWGPRSGGLSEVAPGPDAGTVFGVGRLHRETVLFSADFGSSWTGVHDAGCEIQTIGVDAAGSVFYSAYRSRMIFNLCPGLFRSDDSGGRWGAVNGNLSFRDLAFDPVDPARMYGAVLGWGGVVFDFEASDDGGATWSPLGLPGASKIVPSPSGDVLYAATSTGIRRLVRTGRLVDRAPRTLEPRPPNP